MFEDSQIFLRTLSTMNSMYDLAIGAGYVSPYQIPGLAKAVKEKITRKYYSNLEWMKAQAMQPITEMKDKGRNQIDNKQRMNTWNELYNPPKKPR